MMLVPPIAEKHVSNLAGASSPDPGEESSESVADVGDWGHPEDLPLCEAAGPPPC